VGDPVVTGSGIAGRRAAVYQASMRLLPLLTLASFAALAGPVDGTLDLYWIDSEGGGSTLLVTPAGESVLIDAGNPGGRDPARIHRVATEVAGLKQIDHLVVTHFHIDHFGGAAELAALMPTRHVWDNGLPDADPDGNRQSTWPLTSKPYRNLPAKERHVVQPGTVVPLGGEAGKLVPELRCVMTRQQAWTPPLREFKHWDNTPAPPAKPVDTSDNANSSAWVLQIVPFRFFDGGDLTWNSETKLAWPVPLVTLVDVYQVTHHGFDVSNNPFLVRALNPTVTVMNNSPTKGSAGEVFATFRGLPALKAQYQVHKNTRPDGTTNNCPEAFIANREAKCAGDFIKCSVSPDGRNYTFSIPAHGHTSTYSTRGK
jgi:beta-lactamase superfamily II metal-dependent hydrolase